MMLTINKATKIIGNGPHEKKTLLQKVDLKLQPGEFVTVVGGNGAGKSTLFNCISGSLPLTSGQILIDDQDVTQLSEEKRAAYLSRVFQDPKMGTAPRMTVAENLLLAQRRGQKRNLHLRQLQAQKRCLLSIMSRSGQRARTTFGYTNRKFIWWATPSIESLDGNDPDPKIAAFRRAYCGIGSENV